MAARMKFLVKKMGWDAFKKALDEERAKVKLTASVNDYIKAASVVPVVPPLPKTLPATPAGVEKNPAYQEWRTDNVVAHKFPGYAGVNVRLKLGDLESAKARKLAQVADLFSRGELRITIEQNLFLSWVPAQALPAVYQALAEIGLAEAGAETLEDTTTCPGADTCRLGITSAKGLGAGVSEAMSNGMKRYKDLARQIRVKVSGCPNNCAQHSIAGIGFQGAALKKDGKTVPAHEVFVGGQMALDRTRFGERIGKIPAKNGPKVAQAFLELYAQEKQTEESFSDCMARLGRTRLQEVLAPFQEIPSFDEKPDFYQDWGHANEKFVTRTGIKGECAGTTIQEKVPVMTSAKEHLAQAEAFLAHREYANAQIEAYETIAAAARVPLYVQLVDPFTSEQAIWEFENIFVRSGRFDAAWLDMAEKLEQARHETPAEVRAQALIQKARQFLGLCEPLHAALLAEAVPKNNPL
jgi:ferredoxin-nitrite reductase/sulfite reductase (ferredoxin)